MNNELPQRKSIRLKNYDYSQEGWYCVTICIDSKKHYFGRIVDHKMYLSEMGNIIADYWQEIPEYFSNVQLDAFVVMPNHVHRIINIVGVPLVGTREAGQNDNRFPNYSKGQNMELQSGQPQGRAPTKQNTIGDIVGAFKSKTTNEYIRNVKHNNWEPFNKRFWQRNYYEQIIMSDEAYNNLYTYIENNPYNWDKDVENI